MALPETAPSLADLVQSLPPELYSDIYTHTFTAPTNGIVDIEHDRLFPALLHVDRHSRELFAKSYYDTTKFVLHRNDKKYDGIDAFERWMDRIPGHHRPLVSNFISRIDIPDLDKSDRNTYVAEQKKLASDELMAALDGSYIHHLHVQVWPGGEEGITTEACWEMRARIGKARFEGTWKEPEWENLRATLGGVAV